MADDFDLFQCEERLAREAAACIAAGRSEPCLPMLERLLSGYEGLLRESQQLIRIADCRERDLNRLNRKLQTLTQSLAYQAEHDALTGVLNKSAINSALARQRENGCCVMLLDVDHFKQVNDRHGHLAGDQVLKGLAERIQSVLSDTDLLGRFGGEEFLVVCPQETLRLATAKAERIRLAVAAEPMDIGSGSLAITVSIGLGHASSGETPDGLIGRVDAALYAAKRGGRNRVEVAP